MPTGRRLFLYSANDFSFPGARRLELSFAYRIDSYSHFGASFESEMGLDLGAHTRTQPRGTQGTSFKAPLISQLDAPTTSYTTLLPSSTPGGKPTDALVINGGSQYLQPEKSKSFTAGIDWAPIRWPQIRASMTYFNISYNNRIQSQNIEAEPLGAQPQLFSITGLNPSLDQVLPLFQAPGFQQDSAGLGTLGSHRNHRQPTRECGNDSRTRRSRRWSVHVRCRRARTMGGFILRQLSARGSHIRSGIFPAIDERNEYHCRTAQISPARWSHLAVRQLNRRSHAQSYERLPEHALQSTRRTSLRGRPRISR